MNIEKSKGLTESEHRLVKLGERVFMGLWSYPNPQVETSSGFKELCDLLVICGDNVLIFSDKNIKYNEEIKPFVAWQRWERKAIIESIKQLHHAENIIRDHPEKVWLNPKQKLPVNIPDKKQIKNLELWKELLALTETHKVSFIKVKGHADNEFNNRCDELAVAEWKKLSGGKGNN